MLEARVGEVVEEQAADAGWLAAVPQKKVFVAPALVTRVVIGAEGRERIAASRVEMPRVFGEAVIRREIHAAAKPPGVPGAEEAHVHVHGRAIGIARMQHERKSHRVVGAAGKLRASGASRGRQRGSLHARDADAGALEKVAFFEDARRAAAAFGALPAIRAKALAVFAFQRGDDARLQLVQE